MTSNNNLFVTFPVSNTQTVITGTLRIDFINGKATLPDETVIPLANRSLQTKPLQSIFFNVNNDINIEMSLNDEITYKGLIPAGHFTIKNIKYDLIIITTSKRTEIAISGSFEIDCIVSDYVPYLTKTLGIEILTHQAVIHPNSVVGTTQDVTDIKAAIIVLFHASIEVATANTNPGKFLVQVLGYGDGNEHWATIYEFDATISTADSEAMIATEPIGETVLAVANTGGFTSLDKLYIQDTGTLLNSEWALCDSIIGGASINLIDGLTTAKDNADIIWNDADIFTCQLDLRSIGSIRVLFIHQGTAGANVHIQGLMNIDNSNI